MNPKAIIQAAKILQNVGPKTMYGVARNKAIASTLIPMTYDIAPKLLLWTVQHRPKVAAWAINNNRAVWEHPKYGMDILKKFDEMIIKSGFPNRLAQAKRMKKLDRIDLLHDAAKVRNPIFRGVLGLKPHGQHSFGKNPLYTGLDTAIKNKGKTSVQINPLNPRGAEFISEARLKNRLRIHGGQSQQHTLFGFFGGDKKRFWDTWDFKENNPQMNEALRGLLGKALYYGDRKTGVDVSKEMLTRFLRRRLDAASKPITITGSM